MESLLNLTADYPEPENTEGIVFIKCAACRLESYVNHDISVSFQAVNISTSIFSLLYRYKHKWFGNKNQ